MRLRLTQGSEQIDREVAEAPCGCADCRVIGLYARVVKIICTRLFRIFATKFGCISRSLANFARLSKQNVQLLDQGWQVRGAAAPCWYRWSGCIGYGYR